jgi:helix-turn-helix protein
MSKPSDHLLIRWRWAISDSGLPSTSRHILLTLGLHMSLAGEKCFPSLTTIAGETGLARSTVSKHLASMEGIWITKTARRRSDGGRTSNVYRPQIPSEARFSLPSIHEQVQGSPEAGGGWSESEPLTLQGNSADNTINYGDSVFLDFTDRGDRGHSDTGRTEEESFEEFWREYPTRKGENPRHQAQEEFRARMREGTPADVLVLSARNYAADCAAQRNFDFKFVPHAWRFLRRDGAFEKFSDPAYRPRRKAAVGGNADQNLNSWEEMQPTERADPPEKTLSSYEKEALDILSASES